MDNTDVDHSALTWQDGNQNATGRDSPFFMTAVNGPSVAADGPFLGGREWPQRDLSPRLW